MQQAVSTSLPPFIPSQSYGTYWHHVRGFLQLYLPLLILMGLAGITYLLVQHSELEENIPKALAVGDPDFFAKDLRLLSYQGKRTQKAYFTADEAEHFPHDDSYTLMQIQATIWQKADQTIYVSADKALVNANGDEVQLIENAQLEQQKPPNLPAYLTGDFLHLFLQEERVQSHLPVRFTQGEDTIRANQMQYNQADAFLQLDGRVRGTLYSKTDLRPAKATPRIVE